MAPYILPLDDALYQVFDRLHMDLKIININDILMVLCIKDVINFIWDLTSLSLFCIGARLLKMSRNISS